MIGNFVHFHYNYSISSFVQIIFPRCIEWLALFPNLEHVVGGRGKLGLLGLSVQTCDHDRLTTWTCPGGPAHRASAIRR